jgi:hypothetical protein
MPQEVDAMPFSQSVSEQGPKEAFVGADWVDTPAAWDLVGESKGKTEKEWQQDSDLWHEPRLLSGLQPRTGPKTDPKEIHFITEEV